MLRPSQYAPKLPATNPDRMLSDAPPSRDEATTSLTCPESTDVKTFTSSGMIAPASVPHVMTVDNFHHNVPSPRVGMRTNETRYVSATETIDVSHTSDVSGASKFIRSASPNRAFASASLTKYDRLLATIIMMRITKIHTRSCTCTRLSGTANKMKVM